MLYLNENDILEAVRFTAMVDEMERAMQLEPEAFNMPPRLHVDRGENTLLLMPCFIEDCFATKLVTLFPGNPGRQVPMLNGLVVLNDGRTGAPLAIMDGPSVTAIRTAAVSAVSIRHLAPECAKTLGIVGAGVQAFYQARIACAVRDFTRLCIYDINRQNAEALAKRLTDTLDSADIDVAESSEKLTRASEVIITATTATEPVLPNSAELLAGKHIAAIGSYKPHVREIPDAVFALVDEIYVDTQHAIEESGDLIIPLREQLIRPEAIKTLGSYLKTDRCDDKRKNQTTFFKSVGMALFDVCAARLVYNSALAADLGRNLQS